MLLARFSKVLRSASIESDWLPRDVPIGNKDNNKKAGIGRATVLIRLHDPSVDSTKSSSTHRLPALPDPHCTHLTITRRSNAPVASQHLKSA